MDMHPWVSRPGMNGMNETMCLSVQRMNATLGGHVEVFVQIPCGNARGEIGEGHISAARWNELEKQAFTHVLEMARRIVAMLEAEIELRS